MSGSCTVVDVDTTDTRLEVTTAEDGVSNIFVVSLVLTDTFDFVWDGWTVIIVGFFGTPVWGCFMEKDLTVFLSGLQVGAGTTVSWDSREEILDRLEESELSDSISFRTVLWGGLT